MNSIGPSPSPSGRLSGPEEEDYEDTLEPPGHIIILCDLAGTACGLTSCHPQQVLPVSPNTGPWLHPGAPSSYGSLEL